MWKRCVVYKLCKLLYRNQLIDLADRSLQTYVCEEVALFINEFFDKNAANEKHFNEDFAAVSLLILFVL